MKVAVLNPILKASMSVDRFKAAAVFFCCADITAADPADGGVDDDLPLYQSTYLSMGFPETKSPMKSDEDTSS